jgi:4-hydroxy-3-methylbut-2-enyl diphosphate reductase
MKIIRAKTLGFCTGVRRAVEMAWQASSGSEPVYTLGSLIHNSRVLESLSERGIICLEENEIPSAMENAVVIIRAHGVSPSVQRVLAKQGLTILDATCPHVKISQSRARDFAERGYRIFLAGEENHAEIEGIRGYAEDDSTDIVSPLCFVVSNPVEAGSAAEDLYRREPQARTALIGQTTIRLEEYNAIGELIRQFFPALDVVDSICGATAERQEALRDLCAAVDAVIIVGSRESANTKRLLSLAGELGKPAWLTETPADIPPEISGYETVGISAGASTPDCLIDEVEKALV